MTHDDGRAARRRYVRGGRAEWEEVENMTSTERRMHFWRKGLLGGDVMTGKSLDFTRKGIEHLQEDVITFLDQFEEMPQGLVDDICQTIIDYYNKHRPSTPQTPEETPLNPSGDHKTI